jgi:6-phospho 3-hexuloisomerase
MREYVILDKLADVLRATSIKWNCEALFDLFEDSEEIYLAGAGRSALVAKAFAMRLVHLGYKVHMVGETTTTAIGPNDSLILVSGSGETEQLLSMAQTAVDIGAIAVVVTAAEESSLGEICQATIRVGEPELYGDVYTMPMGTIFELSTMIFLETVVGSIIETKGISEKDMKFRHTNLE